MKGIFVVLFIAVLAIGSSGHSQSNSYWLVNEGATASVETVATIKDSYGYSMEVTRILDFKTGKLIYVVAKSSYDAAPVMIVMDIPHK